LDHEAAVMKKLVAPSEGLVVAVKGLLTEFPISVIVVGDRTGSKKIRQSLDFFGVPVETVDENGSSIEGRYRYLRENTRGWLRLLPIGLRTPNKPFDDYVAVILAERFLKKHPISLFLSDS
jgi:hypothetical protein